MLFEHDPPLSCVLEFLLRRAGAPTRINPISLKSANPPDGRRAKAAIRLENRQALGHLFSQGFIRDFALVWAEEGLKAAREVAKKILRPLWRRCRSR